MGGATCTSIGGPLGTGDGIPRETLEEKKGFKIRGGRASRVARHAHGPAAILAKSPEKKGRRKSNNREVDESKSAKSLFVSMEKEKKRTRKEVKKNNESGHAFASVYVRQSFVATPLLIAACRSFEQSGRRKNQD